MEKMIKTLTDQLIKDKENVKSRPILQIVCDDLETNPQNMSYYKSLYTTAKELGVEVIVDRYKKFDMPTLYMTGSRSTHEYDVEDYSTARAVKYIIQSVSKKTDNVVLIAGRNRFAKEIRDALERTTDFSICMINSKLTNKSQRQALVNASDFIISATGNPETFDGIDFFPYHSLIDVGRGDFGKKEHEVYFQTPRINGVGKITTLMLLQRVIEYYSH